MTIISRGYEPDESATKDVEAEWQLFSQNIDLILKYEQDILACSDYFFCSLPFAYCSWPYVNGDGQLFLGYLLLGWKSGQLMETCPTCMGQVMVSSFSGSPLTGCNSWSGLCLDCHQRQQGNHSEQFRQWIDVVLKFRQAFPDKVSEEQEYDSQEFTWGGNGLSPVRRKRLVWRPVSQSVGLASLVKELQTGNIRKSSPANVSLLKKDFKLKFSSNRLNSSCSILL